jgi:hypothetical protein
VLKRVESIVERAVRERAERIPILGIEPAFV